MYHVSIYECTTVHYSTVQYIHIYLLMCLIKYASIHHACRCLHAWFYVVYIIYQIRLCQWIGLHSIAVLL